MKQLLYKIKKNIYSIGIVLLLMLAITTIAIVLHEEFSHQSQRNLFWFILALGIAMAVLIVIIAVFLNRVYRKQYVQSEIFAAAMENFEKYTFEFKIDTQLVIFTKRTQKNFGIEKELYSLDDLTKSRYILLEDKVMIEKTMVPTLVKMGECEANLFCPRTNKHVHIRVKRFKLSSTKKDYIMGVIEDVTELMMSQEALTKKAQNDGLTKLLNRETFIERVDEVIKANPVARHALFIMDIDNFKQINDKYGHYIGDVVLQKFATSMNASVDLRKAQVARLGGDEFAIFIKNIDTNSLVEDYAKSICSKVGAITVADDIDYYLSSSMGISIYPKHGSDFEVLYRCADNALYDSKEVFGVSYTIYDSIESTAKQVTHGQTEVQDHQVVEDNFSVIVNTEGAEGREEMKQILSESLKNKEFKIYAQPQVSTKLNSGISCEILARWISPVYGLMMPNKFIHLFEATKTMELLDRYMLEETLNTLEKKTDELENIDHVSVNQSIATITAPDYLVFLLNLVKVYPATTKKLVVEITERDIFVSKRTIFKVIKSIRAIGVEVSIDDFGSGYTTLSILKDASFDELKLDKIFVDNKKIDKRSSVVISNVCNMAHSLNIRTIAEGVETIEQARLLTKMGVDFIQGFYVSKGIPLNDFIKKNNENYYKKFSEDFNFEQ